MFLEAFRLAGGALLFSLIGVGALCQRKVSKRIKTILNSLNAQTKNCPMVHLANLSSL